MELSPRQEQKTEACDSFIGNLPELERMILLRLPVNSLLRCKCVSHRLRNLIGNPGFVKEYHCKNVSNQRQRLLIRNGSPFNVEGYLVNVDAYKHVLYVDESFSEYEEPILLQIPGRVRTDSDLIGPVKGVFCVVSMKPDGPMGLLNPALRQFKPLPRINVRIDKESVHLSGMDLGLGIDPVTDDFKVVAIADYLFDRQPDRDQRHFSRVYVCNSESISWRHLENVGPVISSHSLARSHINTYLDGVYYWLLKFDERTPVPIVYAFHMSREKFKKIKVKCCFARSKLGCLALCGDTLALLTYNVQQPVDYRCIDVFLMKSEDSWVRSSRVFLAEEIKHPLCLWSPSQVIVEMDDSFLGILDVSTQELKRFETCRVEKDDRCSHWIFIYKETLVPIKGECVLWDVSSELVKNFLTVAVVKKGIRFHILHFLYVFNSQSVCTCLLVLHKRAFFI